MSTADLQALAAISIHAPLTGSDGKDAVLDCGTFISIHAPLTGSDWGSRIDGEPFCNFNPRSPHRERLYFASIIFKIIQFQSTLPSQGATELS